ncbi:sugar phosphate isomerase/epimerase [Candidatus Poribacteria bacterium]|nr:sugar phosphate isomerase/epimerase [Candidatus Poribacteria bacterium]
MIIGIPAGASGANLGGGAEAIKTLLSYCEEIGVRHAGIGAPIKDGHPDTAALTELKQQLADAGLSVFGGGIFFAREENFFEQSFRDEEREQLVELIDCYGKAGVEPVTIFCSLAPGKQPDEQETRWKLAIDFTRVLVKTAENAGVRLAVHTLGNSVFNRYATVERMLCDIPSDYLGVCYDPAIHLPLGDDIAANLRALKDKMPVMHLRTSGDVTPMNTFELKDGKFQDVPVRKPQVDIPEVIKVLLEVNYNDIVQLEHQRGPIAYARAVGYLRGIIETLQ